MKNKIKYIAFLLMLMLFGSTNVSAATIRESATNGLEPGTLVIGITKFSNDAVLTAAKSSTAGFNDAIFKINNRLPLEEPKVYLYSGGSGTNQIWFEIGDSGQASIVKKEEVPEAVDIYYVNNVEKTVEVPYLGDLKTESIPDGIKYENNKFIVPATNTEFEFQTSSGGTIVASLDIEDPNKGVTISEVKYSITYYDTKGQAIGKPVLLGSNDRTVKPMDPIQEYDIFQGWKLKGSSDFFVFGNPIDENIELVASFKDAAVLNVNLNYEGAPNYTIKGILDGKKLKESLMDVQNKLETPTRSEYRFLGWYLEAAGTNKFDPETTILSNGMTIYAKWGYEWYLNGIDTSNFVITNQNQLDYLIANIEEVNGKARTIVINDFADGEAIIKEGISITIPSSTSLTVNGKLNVKGTLNVEGTLNVKGTIVGESDTKGIITGTGTLINNGEITAAVRKSLMSNYSGTGYVSLPSRAGTSYITSEINTLGDVSGTGGKLNYTLDKNELTIKPQAGELVSIATNPTTYGSDAAYWVGFRLNMPVGTISLSTRKWYVLEDNVYSLLGSRDNDASSWDYPVKEGVPTPGWAFYQHVDNGKKEVQYQVSYKMGEEYNFEVYNVIFDIEEDDLSKSLTKNLGEIKLNKPEFTVDNDIEILSGKTVTIVEGTTVTISEGKTLTVNGNLVINGSLVINGNLVVNGTVTNNGSIKGNIKLAGTLKQNTALKDNEITMLGASALIETPFGTGTMSFAGTSAGAFIVSENAVIKTYESTNTKQGAALIEIVSGTLTLNDNHIITPNAKITIASGAKFIIPEGKTLYNYGAIVNNGTLTINGTLTEYNDIAEGPLATVWSDAFTTNDIVENRGISGSGIIDIKGIFNNNGLISTTGVTNLYGTINNAGIIATKVKMKNAAAVVQTPWNDGWITFAGVNNSNATFSLTLDSEFKSIKPESTKVGAIDIEFISGTVTLNSNHIITPNARITIASGAEFIISNGKTLSNYGQIVVKGTLTINGTLDNYTDVTKGMLGTYWGMNTFTNSDKISNQEYIYSEGTVTNNGSILQNGATL